jgi:hypothetical protein
MRLIGPPSATKDTVLANLAGLKPHPRFTGDMFPELWDAAEFYGIDPVGVVAQSYKETGGGTFGGAVLPQFFNPCGLKIRNVGIRPETTGDQPLAHAMFPSWEVGATAHVQHLCAYAGMPAHGLIVDPRYAYVVGKHALENWSELGGKWAPSPFYGIEIESLMETLRRAAA